MRGLWVTEHEYNDTTSAILRKCWVNFSLFVFVSLKPDEISEVKNISIDFVRKSSQEKGASFTYILVPFSDPGRLSIFW